MEVRHKVSEKLKVHFCRIENTLNRLGRAHHIAKKERLLLSGEVIWFAYMLCAYQHAIARRELIRSQA